MATPDSKLLNKAPVAAKTLPNKSKASRAWHFMKFPLMVAGAIVVISIASAFANKLHAQDKQKKGAKIEVPSDTAFESKKLKFKQAFEAAKPEMSAQFADTSYASLDGFVRFHDKDGNTIRVLSSQEAERVMNSENGLVISGFYVKFVKGGLFYAYKVSAKTAQEQSSPQ